MDVPEYDFAQAAPGRPKPLRINVEQEIQLIRSRIPDGKSRRLARVKR